MSPTLLALAATVVLAGSSRMTKYLAGSFPHLQLVGPLLLLNSALVVPFAAVVHWHLTTPILLLHLASAATLVVGSFCMFELFSQGSAAAVAVGQAMTPLPALGFSVLLLASPVTTTQAIGGIVVTVAALAALGPVFGRLSRGRAVVTVALAAALNGLLVVLTKLLSDRGAALPEIYVARTAVAGVVSCLIVPPRHIPLRALPRLTFRSALQTVYFVLLIAAIERGSPATVQTIVATTPILLLATDALVHRQRPPVRLAVAAVGVVAGVALAVA